MRGSFTWLTSVLVIASMLTFGCARPGRKRWTESLASVGSRLVAVVKSGAVKVDANTAIKAAAQTPPPAQRVREEPPPVQRQPPLDAQHQQAPPPDIHVDRVDTSRPTIFVLRGETQSGKDFCEQHPTLEACTSACTAMLRPNMFTKPGPTSPTGCACTEQTTGC